MNKKSNNTEILNEFIRCINDKNYFINKYVKVEKPFACAIKFYFILKITLSTTDAAILKLPLLVQAFLQ